MSIASPSARVTKIAAIAAIPAAMVASGLIVSQASFAAYSATTTNPSSNWATGTVALSDDDADTAAFNAVNLKPGSSESKCIVVSSTGDLASAVKLYTTGAVATNDLSDHITLSITQGFGGGLGSCTGYNVADNVYAGSLATLTRTATNYNNGLGIWEPSGTGTETKTYQITYTVSESAPNTTQGGTAAVGFTWEAQNS